MNSHGTRTDQDAGVSIADAVDNLRTELAEATRRGIGQDVQFVLGVVKLSLDVSVTRSLEAGGGVRFWVVNADAGVGQERVQSHRVEVELRPVIAGVVDPRIAAQQLERPEQRAAAAHVEKKG